MNTLMLTDHAVVRLAQRGITMKDSELIALIGTEVDDGYLVLSKDYQDIEKVLKGALERFRRIRGKRLVVDTGRILTGYHSSERTQRRLMRNAHERGLSE